MPLANSLQLNYLKLLRVSAKCKVLFPIRQKLHCGTCILCFSLLLKSVCQMQYFDLLKFHGRWWTQTDSKAFSQVMKMHFTTVRGFQRTQTSKAGQWGEQRDWLLLSCHFVFETWLGCCKASNILWSVNNALYFVPHLLFWQLHTIPFHQTWYLKLLHQHFLPCTAVLQIFLFGLHKGHRWHHGLFLQGVIHK